MKRPSFQFYPGDWLRDMGLRGCSLEARGLWADLLCLMHDGNPYGHLATKAGAWTDKQGAAATGTPLPVYRALVKELEDADVFTRDVRGAIYSRRMVRDEDIRQKRASAGRVGGAVTQASVRANSQSNGRPTNQAKPEQLVAGEEEDEEVLLEKGSGEKPLGYLTRCVVALNRGLAANPHLVGRREVSTSEQQGRVTWEVDGIPVDTAAAVVESVARAFRPTERNRQPNSLKYFDDAVRRAAEQPPTEDPFARVARELEPKYAAQ